MREISTCYHINEGEPNCIKVMLIRGSGFSSTGRRPAGLRHGPLSAVRPSVR